MLSPNLDPWLCPWLYTRPSKQPQRTIMAMYTSLQTCFSFASQEHKTIRKHIRLLVKSDFTSNCTGFFGYEPYGSASLQTTPAYIHGYVHIPPNNPSVHPWLCTHPSKQPQRTSMAMYTSLQTCFTFVHTIACKNIKRSWSSQYDCSWSQPSRSKNKPI